MHRDEPSRPSGSDDTRRRILTRPRLAVPAAAAGVAVVVAIAIGVATLAPSRGVGTDAHGSGVGPAAAGPNAPGLTRITSLPSMDFGKPQSVRAVPVSEAIADMVRAAQTVPATPVGSGQVIFVQSEGIIYEAAARALAAETYEIALEPQGMIALSLSRNLEAVPGEHLAAHNADSVARFAEQGPSLSQPTPHWVAGLPTNKSELLALLGNEVVVQKGSFEHTLLNQIGDLFFTSDPLFTPQVRVAFYQVLGGISGLTTSELTIEGRRLLAFRHTENGSADELLLDPSNGRVAGRRTIALNDLPGVSAGDPTHVTLWTQTVIDRTN